MTMTGLKSNFRVSNRIEAFYTGGKVHISSNGNHIFCTHGDAVNILDSQTGKTIHSIKDEGADEVTSFAVTADDEVLVVAYRNSLLKQWDWKEGICTRTWQSLHRAPVVSMAFDSTSTLLATGSGDATIKVWDIVRQYCTHNLRGSQGVVSLVQFHPDPEKLHLYSVSDDNHIRVWELQTSRCLAVLQTHYGAVTALAFTPDGQTLLSSGRDSVVVIWDLVKNEAKKTIPVFESLEAVIVLPNDKDYSKLTGKKANDGFNFLTAGSKGIIRVWSSTGRCLHKQEGSPLESAGRQAHRGNEDQDELTVITHAVLCQMMDCIAVVTYDHNILLFQLEDLKLKKQFVGYNDEILDLKLMGKHETHLAVASNSEQIRVFELGSGSCQILTGHTDIVLALDVFKKGAMLVSSSKDNSVRVWRMDAESCVMHCMAVGSGHTNSVCSLAAARLSTKFCVSGSEDCTLKVWKIPAVFAEEGIKEPVHMKVSFTEKAHDKDINSISISPNDKLMATGSQDRLAKLWHLEKEVLLGSFRGHRRGIWCVQFSPTDQALATSSADGSIKIWALSDFSCVKTFEGHDASVLKVMFLTRGMQLLSSGSDGLLKLWTIKTNECVATLDEHSDKVWSVTADRSEQRLVTAGADSTILIWEDVTQIEFEEKAEKEEDQILKEQQLSNLMHSKKFTKALRLAITLDQPFKALGIIKTILEEPGGEKELEKAMSRLRPDHIESVLKFAQAWNTNSKHCHTAQAVIGIVLRSQDPDDLVKFPGLRGILEGLLPYTERHFQRLSRLVQQAMFVQYTWQVMRRASGLPDSVDEAAGSSVEDAASGLGEFFLERKKGGATAAGIDPAEDSSEEESDEDHHGDEDDDDDDEDGTMDGKKAGVRSPRTLPGEGSRGLKAKQDSGSSEDETEEEEEEEDEVQKQSASSRTGRSKTMNVDVSDTDEEDAEAERAKPTPSRTRTKKDKVVEEEEEDMGVEDEEAEKENKSITRSPSLGGKGQNSGKKRRGRSLRHKGTEAEEEGGHTKKQTRQAVQKTPFQQSKTAKRKSPSTSLVASEEPVKKSSPSPYTKKLRRSTRK